MSPTIGDVAQAADVSIATVSRVLNNHSSVSLAARKAVLLAVQKVGYKPELYGKSGKSGRKLQSLLIAYDERMYPLHQFNLFFVELLHKLVEGEAASRGITVSLEAFRTDESGQALLPTAVQRDLVDGVIVFGYSDDKYIQCLSRDKVYFVHLEEIDPSRDSVVVQTDHIHNISLLVEHLLELGHRRLGIAACQDMPWETMAQHVLGFELSMRKAGLEFKPEEQVFPFKFEELYVAGRRVAQQILKRAERPTAIIFSEDTYAVQAIITFQSEGLNVPRDISVVGCGNYQCGLGSRPTLTTIKKFPELSAQRAIEKLAELIEKGPSEVPEKIYIPGRLIARDSSGPALSGVNRAPGAGDLVGMTVQPEV